MDTLIHLDPLPSVESSFAIDEHLSEQAGTRLARLWCHRPSLVLGLRDARLARMDQHGGVSTPLPGFDTVTGRGSWGNPAASTPDLRSIAVTDAGTWLVAVHVGGVWRSADHGASWTNVVPPGDDVHEVVSGHAGVVVAAAARDGRLLLADVASGQVSELARSDNGPITDLSFAPDSAWLAWSQPEQEPLARIRLARVADASVTDVTDGRFADTEPAFSQDGLYLAFLSRRTFDPVYDAHAFDMAFPYGARPYLVTLAASTPSPFGPLPGGPDGGGAVTGTGRLARSDGGAAPPRPGARMPALRAAHGRFAAAVATRADVRLVLAETDEVVDALDTAAAVLGLLADGEGTDDDPGDARPDGPDGPDGPGAPDDRSG